MGSVTEYAWVIEDPQSPTSAPRYYTLRPNQEQFWSYDHADALRFARKQDAEDYVAHFVQHDGARICEHGWG